MELAHAFVTIIVVGEYAGARFSPEILIVFSGGALVVGALAALGQRGVDPDAFRPWASADRLRDEQWWGARVCVVLAFLLAIIAIAWQIRK